MLEARSSGPGWAIQQDPISTKIKINYGQAWWLTPVIPILWEAEADISLEPERWKLQFAEITPLHSSLGDRARLHLKKKERKKEKEKKSQNGVESEMFWVNLEKQTKVKSCQILFTCYDTILCTY